MHGESDVLVVGGGPSGVTAALYLARAGKRTLVVDADEPRNSTAEHVHGMIGFDGRSPSEIRAAGRAALARYVDVSIQDARVLRVERDEGRLVATLSTGESVRARSLLVATGLRDELPPHPGLRERWGISVFACPHCHGHELRGRRWAVLVSSRAEAHAALLCRAWTSDVVALLDAREVDRTLLRALTDRGIAVEPRRIAALHGPGRALTEIELEGGDRVPCEALVINPPKRQSDLVLALGLALDESGYVQANQNLETSMPGVYVCGDAAGLPPQAVMAAADGAAAAMRIVETLTLEDLGLR